MKGNGIPVVQALVVGMAAGLSAVVMQVGIGWLASLKIYLAHLAPAYLVLPALGLIGGYVSGLIVERVAPETSGSGIPQVKAALSRVRQTMNLRVALAKLVGGTIALGSGLFLGREGPTVHVGAALAAQLNRWMPVALEHRRQLIAAGAGAGLAAAFNAPIAGVIFVLEELLKEVKASTIGVAVLACFSASLVLNFFGIPYLHIAFMSTAVHASFKLQDIPFYLILGCLSGVVGALFNRGIFVFLNFNRDHLKIPTSLKVALAGAISGATLSFLPDMLQDFARMKALILAGALTAPIVPIAFIVCFFLTLIAYGSGAPGGLFAPSLALGSALGYMVGVCNQLVFGTQSMETFALVGMGAFFSAIGRVPLTAIVIIFEMTADFGLVMPLMIACVISSTVAQRLDADSLYDLLMIWSGINLKGPGERSQELELLKCKDIMSEQYEKLSYQATLKEALDLFAQSKMSGFPVVAEQRLVGVISRSDLQQLNLNEVEDDTSVYELMTPYPVSVNPEDSLEEILLLFTRYQFTWLPVTKEETMVGIILRTDVAKTLLCESNEVVLEQPDCSSTQGVL